MKEKSTKNFWLLKSEPDAFSIDDLQKNKKEIWSGVRNYQARNFMRDQMCLGDECFFYHSSCDVPGIAGLCKVTKVNVVDPTQFEGKGEYFDPKSKIDNPSWICVEVSFVEKFKNIIPLSVLRADPKLSTMRLLQPGSRLSVQPVTEKEFTYIKNKFLPMV